MKKKLKKKKVNRKGSKRLVKNFFDRLYWEPINLDTLEKKEYDIKLKSKEIVTHVYPNGDFFIKFNSNRIVPKEDVIEIRLSIRPVSWLNKKDNKNE